MPRVAVRVAYDGTCFAGSQRQPDQRTVEGELLRGLAKVGALRSAEEARFQCASRTDRGVSAAGNVVAFDTSFRLDALLPALAGHGVVAAMGAADVVFVLHLPGAVRTAGLLLRDGHRVGFDLAPLLIVPFLFGLALSLGLEFSLGGRGKDGLAALALDLLPQDRIRGLEGLLAVGTGNGDVSRHDRARRLERN
jgi:hypothetical protein